MSDVHVPTLTHPTQTIGEIISDTNDRTGVTYTRFRVLANAQITSATTPRYRGNLAGITIAAGVEFEGPITQIKLASGSIIAYEK